MNTKRKTTKPTQAEENQPPNLDHKLIESIEDALAVTAIGEFAIDGVLFRQRLDQATEEHYVLVAWAVSHLARVNPEGR